MSNIPTVSTLRMLKVTLLITLVCSTNTALAGGDIQKGKAKSAACGACHGALGISTNSLWPHLAGQNEDYLAKQLRDFKSGTRNDPVMSGMARPLSDQDIENLAAYFSSLQ